MVLLRVPQSEDDLEGLLHISELANHKVENPEDVVKVGDEIGVRLSDGELRCTVNGIVMNENETERNNK